jgi:integrase
MSNKYIKVEGVTGLRYREHPTRKHRGQPDKYFFVRYSRSGEKHEEGIGWSSEGWNIGKCTDMVNALRTNYRKGSGPNTLAALREEYHRKEQAAERRRAEDAARSVSFAEFFRSIYLPAAKEKKSSWRDDEIRAEKRIIPALGDVPLDAITTDLISDFRDEMESDELADATIRQYLALIRRVFNVAAMTSVDGIPLFRGESPMRGIDMPSPENERARFLSKDEARALLAACLGHVAEPQRANHAAYWQDLHDAMLLSLYAGLRVGEIQRLEWPDVNFFSGHIAVRRKKGGKPGGTVPANAELMEMLRRRMQHRSKGVALVFVPVNGGKQRENISHLFSQLVDELGLNADVTDTRHKVVFHSLRHTFASWMAMDGVDIYRIKELMRHKTITMTMRYAKLSPDANRDAVEGLSLRNSTPKSGQLLHFPDAKTAHGPLK